MSFNLNNFAISKPGCLKLMIFGNGGTGKSTLGSKLSTDLNIPVVHLDKLVWRENYEVVPEQEFKRRLAEILLLDNIIVEGWSNQSTLLERIKWADVIIYLKHPLEHCLKVALQRNVDYNFKTNPFDNYTGDRVAKNELYIKAVERVHYEYEPIARQWLQDYAPNKPVIIFTSMEELNENYNDLVQSLKEIGNPRS